jgi:hypothetical protein
MADYYVDGLVGNDANDGLSEGAAGAWATIGQAISNPIAAGDRLYVKASASYAESPDFNSTINGVIANPIVLEGYTTTPGDGGRASITGDGSAITLFTGSFYSTRNFTITGGADRGVKTGNFCVVENCEVDGSAGTDRGFETFTDCYTVGCYAHDCTTTGFRLFGVGGAFACIADTCVKGIQSVARTFGYFYCIARGNTSGGLEMGSNGNSELMVNCTVDGLSSSLVGITQGTSGHISTVINCVVINCTTGITGSSSGGTARNFSANNCLFGNTANYSAGATTPVGEVLADPTFFDEAAKDYGPNTGSPCIRAGYDFRSSPLLTMSGDKIDIGALQGLGGGSNFRGAFFSWGVN